MLNPSNPPNLSNLPSPSNPPNPQSPSNAPSRPNPSYTSNPCPHTSNPRLKDSLNNVIIIKIKENNFLRDSVKKVCQMLLQEKIIALCKKIICKIRNQT